MLKNYVISLNNNQKRRKHILQEFSKQNIPFEFFDAYSPSPELTQKIALLLPQLNNAPLTSGEKGCFISHLALWHKCLDENLPYIAIFEDDILLGENADSFLNHNKWLGERFQTEETYIIRLETFLQPARCDTRTKILQYQQRNFYKLLENHYGTAGYIISRNAILFLLEKFKIIPSDKFVGIDILMFEKYLGKNNYTVYQLNPALIVQELQLNKEKSLLNSQIQQERAINQRKHRLPKPKKTWKEKIIHLLTKYKRIKNKKERQKFIIPFM